MAVLKRLRQKIFPHTKKFTRRSQICLPNQPVSFWPMPVSTFGWEMYAAISTLLGTQICHATIGAIGNLAGRVIDV
jgi:hypothetical protein